MLLNQIFLVITLQTNSDIYTGWFYDGKAYITDRFAYGRQLPAIDPEDRQDIYDMTGKIVDDVQVIRKTQSSAAF